jgi:ABC-type molybdenum transport system ATPase subunit/photorepair protein PhrA
MIAWLHQNFPIGKNYLVCQNHNDQINSFLAERLVAPFQSGRKHNLWGEAAKKLPLIGKQLGWIPNSLPAIFLSETVEQEIADAIATTENLLQPQPRHFDIARNMLSRFNLLNLAQQNPLHLSEGETKILWFLTQWLKKPEYLIIGYLPAGLSKRSIKDVINFLAEEQLSTNNTPTIILGYEPVQIDWCAALFSDQHWRIITAWPDQTNIVA